MSFSSLVGERAEQLLGHFLFGTSLPLSASSLTSRPSVSGTFSGGIGLEVLLKGPKVLE